jgi:hypothetical protein
VSLSCYGFSCSKEERFLWCFGAVLGLEVFRGFPGQNQPDWFPLPVERLSPTESV